MQFLILNEYDNYHGHYENNSSDVDVDDDDDDDDDDEEEEDEDDNKRKGWLVTIDNIQEHPNSHSHLSEKSRTYNFILKISSRSLILKAIEMKDIQEFKDAIICFKVTQ